MAPTDLSDERDADCDEELAAAETRATLTLPSGWCCGFARRVAEGPDGRRATETIFATRGGLRLTFSREFARRPSAPRIAAEQNDPQRLDPTRRQKGSLIDILI
ncbi:MAG TPA: hypothetical protein VGB82_10885 [Alphaproteobacteria bacterium]